MGYFPPCVTSLISYWYSWNAIYKLQGQYCPVACRYTTDDEALFDSHDILRNTSIYQNNSIKTCLLEFNITVTIKEKWKLFVECRFQNSYKIVINMFLLDSTLNKSPQHGFYFIFFSWFEWRPVETPCTQSWFYLTQSTRRLVEGCCCLLMSCCVSKIRN